MIGESTAERIKHEIGLAYPANQMLQMEVRGRNLAEGIPRSFTITSNEILEHYKSHYPASWVRSAQHLEQAPPELAADIAERVWC